MSDKQIVNMAPREAYWIPANWILKWAQISILYVYMNTLIITRKTCLHAICMLEEELNKFNRKAIFSDTLRTFLLFHYAVEGREQQKKRMKTRSCTCVNLLIDHCRHLPNDCFGGGKTVEFNWCQIKCPSYKQCFFALRKAKASGRTWNNWLLLWLPAHRTYAMKLKVDRRKIAC